MRPISKGGVGSGVKGHETAQPTRQSDKERKNEQEMEKAIRLAQEEVEAGHRFRADRYKIRSLVNFLQIVNEEEKRRVKKGGPGSGRHPESGSLPDGCSWETPKDWKFVGSDRVLDGSTGEPTDKYLLNYLTSKGNAVQVQWSKDWDSDAEAWKPADKQFGEIVSALDQLNPEGGVELLFFNTNFGDGTSVAYYKNDLRMAAGTRNYDFYQHQILIADKGIYEGVVRQYTEEAMGGEQPDHFSPFSSTREYGYTHYQVGGISTNSAEVAFNIIAHELGHYAFERDMEISYSDKAQDGRDKGFHWETKNLDKLVPVLCGMAELAIEGNEFWNRQEYLTEEERDLYYEMTTEAYWKEQFSKIQSTERNHFGKGVWDYTGGFNPIERQMLQEAGMTEYGSKNPAEFVAETYAMAMNRAIMTSDTPPPVVGLMKENFPRWNVAAPIQKGDLSGHEFHGNQYEQVTGEIHDWQKAAGWREQGAVAHKVLDFMKQAINQPLFTDTEAKSICGYLASSGATNEYLRTGKKIINDFNKEGIESIKSAMGKSTTSEPMTVFRILPKSALEHSLDDSVMTDKGFLSTSLFQNRLKPDENQALVQINVPIGTNCIAPLASPQTAPMAYAEEAEVIFPPNTSLRFIGTNPNGNLIFTIDQTTNSISKAAEEILSKFALFTIQKGGPGSGRHKESNLTKDDQQAIQAWTENCDGWGCPSRKQLEEIAKRANEKAPELWRGIQVDDEDYSKLMKSLQVGETVKLPFSSWSRKKLVGEQFASEDSPMGYDEGDKHVVFHIPQGARGVNAEPYAIEDFKYQAEWLIPESSFKVVSVTKGVPFTPLSEDPTMPEWVFSPYRSNNYVLVELEPL
jgi:ADP-ribosyltransferase exoenzyme